MGHFVKIVGGREAEPHSYPWAVALTGFPKEGKFFCGATIISSRFLVTAGHCFYTSSEDWSFDKIRVRLGVHNLTHKNELTIKPKSYKIYEGFTEENAIDAPLFDIALIELEEDLPINDKIKPVCIHSKYFNYHINDLKASRQSFIKRGKREIHHKLPLSINGSSIDEQNNQFDNNNDIDDDVLDSPQDDEKKKIRLLKRPILGKHPNNNKKIILNHPDKNLIQEVIRMTKIYHHQIRNDPVEIFDPSKEFTKDKLSVVGWGSIDRYDTRILPDVLMETEISQKKPEICENSYGDDVFLRSKMICANEEGKLKI